MNMFQSKDIEYKWAEILSIFGAASVLTTLIYTFIAL